MTSKEFNVGRWIVDPHKETQKVLEFTQANKAQEEKQ